jgi:uncharacterized membrane protein
MLIGMKITRLVQVTIRLVCIIHASAQIFISKVFILEPDILIVAEHPFKPMSTNNY